MAVDGYLKFDTKINTKGFNLGTKQIASGLGGLKSSLGKFAAAAGVAFSVAKLVQFGKAAIEVASDLDEVQNVVDVAFGDMKYKMEEFADTAIQQFGISELAAKKTGSTFMAMARGMGIASGSASDMAVALTGLSADMASFYNVQQDVASTALKSVFTGETETLKNFGIVMTEANLQAYALTQGINAKVSALSQAEKVQLRYNYVMQQTALAQGDFARTAQGWANQTRILSMQWQQFSAVIGKALKNIVLPVINALNRALGTLITFATRAYNTLAALFGWESSIESAGVTAAEDTSAAIADSVGNQEALTDAVNETAKANERSLAGFDKINKLSDNAAAGGSSGGAGAGGAGAGGIAGGGTDIDINVDADTSKADKALGEFQKRWAEGDYSGIGRRIGEMINAALYSVIDALDWDEINDRVETSVGGFAQVINAAFETIDWKAAGGILGNGLNTAVLALYTFVDTLDFTEIGKSVGGLLTGALEKINFKTVGATVVAWFTALPDYIIGLIEGTDFSMVGTSVSDLISGAFSKATNWLQGIDWQSLGTDLWTKLVDLVNGVDWRGLISKAFELLGSALGGIGGLVSGFATSAWDSLVRGFENTKEYFNTFIEDAGGNVIKGLWNGIINALKNIKAWIIENIWNPFINGFKDAFGINSPSTKMEEMGDYIIQGLINGIVAAFEKVKTWFAGAVESIKSFFAGLPAWFGGIWTDITTAFGDVKQWFSDKFFEAREAIKAWFTNIPTWFGGVWNGITSKFANVKQFFSDRFFAAREAAKTWFTNIPTWFGGVWNGITAKFANVKKFFSDKFVAAREAVKEAFSKIPDWFKDKFSSAWEKVKNVFSKGGKIFDGIKDGILNGLKTVINGLIGGINKVIEIPFKGINFALEKIKNISIAGNKPFYDRINLINVPQIPKLASGTVVPASYGEFLAILGDNRREAEVVSPLSTMKQAVAQALKEHSSGCETINLTVDLDGQTIYKTVVKCNKQNTKQTGVNALAS